MSDHDTGHSEGRKEFRTTAPMQPYSGRQVGIGLIVLVVGLLVAFGIPLLV